MEIPKLIIFLTCCVSHSFTSEHSHTIPVENYETELQDLGSHVEPYDPPLKIIKITKTIAVKIPVPYPVKVVQKVPYPVHISKPYPVPVPQIVHLPKRDDASLSKPRQENQVLDAPQGYGQHNSHQHSNDESPEVHYEVQEQPSYNGNPDYKPHFGTDDDGHSLDTPNGNHYFPGSDSGSFESRSYDQAINQYLQKQHPGSSSGVNSFHFN